MSEKTEKHPAARQYYRAFYQNNRLRFALAMFLTILSFPGNLIGSWLLGEVIDVVAARDLDWLWQTLVFTIIFFIVMFLLSLGMYRAKSSFVYRALAQYKSLAFQNLSEKSISAFSRENTGRYLSILTNDTGTIETNYLESSFRILDNAVLFLGCIGMMLWYSPMLAVIVVAFSVLPIAVAVLTDSACILLAEGMALDEDARLRGEQQDVTVLKTPLPVYEAARAAAKALGLP